MTRIRTLLPIGAAVVALAAVPATSSATTVYAAASLRSVFPQIAPATYNFAGSNTLLLQIQRGAPADVFAAASTREPKTLFGEQRCEKPVTFATNRVVLIVPRNNPAKIRTVNDLGRGAVKRVASTSPSVPIGNYSRQLLRRMRLSHVLTRNTVSTEPDVAGVTAKVALGSADAGFVYATDAKLVSDRVRVIALPRWAQPPVRYDLCVVRRSGVDAAGARRYIAQVTGNRGRKLLRAAGFGLPAR